MVQKTLIRPPASRLGPALDAERVTVQASSPLKGLYDTAVDRESAHEMLQRRAEAADQAEKAARAPDPRMDRLDQAERDQPRPRTRSASGSTPRPRAPAAPRRSNRQSTAEAFTTSMARSVGSSIGRAIFRGILGGLTRR